MSIVTPSLSRPDRDLETLVQTQPLAPFGLCVTPRAAGSEIAALSVAALRALVRQHRLVLLRGFAPLPSPEALTAYCERWGEAMRWPFGTVLELIEHAAPTDHIFDHSCVPYHWDGMYTPFVPALQIFQCVADPEPGAGGETLFADTTRIVADADAATRARWERAVVRYEIQKRVHYGGRAVSPLVTRSPVDGATVLRFNEPPPDEVRFLNRPTLGIEGLEPAEAAGLVAELRARLYDPRYMYAHAWRAGDIVIADNHALLHARAEFVSRSARHLRRVHVLDAVPHRNPAIATEA